MVWYVPRLRWLVARRGKTLGPQVAGSRCDGKHSYILRGVSLRFVAEAQEIEARVLVERRDDLSVPGLGAWAVPTCS